MKALVSLDGLDHDRQEGGMDGVDVPMERLRA